MMQSQRNAIHGAAMQAMHAKKTLRSGIVTGYNPDTYSAKVKLQPNGVETGWIPISTIWVGNGWGLQVGPSINDLVTVEFQEGDENSGVVLGALFNNEDRPMPVPSGEVWMKDAAGSTFRFLAGGIVELVAASELRTSAPVWNHTGPLNVTGGDVTADGISLKTHKHGGVQGGSNSTGVPL